MRMARVLVPEVVSSLPFLLLLLMLSSVTVLPPSSTVLVSAYQPSDKPTTTTTTATSRRQVLAQCWGTAAVLGSTALLPPQDAVAAPPIAIIAEELGYFPVTNNRDETVYIPKRITRQSTSQAIALAQKLRDSGTVVYTAYWCPHCARQREVWGQQAWQELNNVECAPKGYNAQPNLCVAKAVDGYPTTVLGNGQRISGERSLVDIAKEVGYQGFRPELETNLPPLLGSAACK